MVQWRRTWAVEEQQAIWRDLQSMGRNFGRLRRTNLISYGELPAYYEADEILPIYADDLS